MISFYLKVKVGSPKDISLLTSCPEGKMLLGTTLDISFGEILFLLIVALFHKAAFMNFMFPKQCRTNLLGFKCETLIVITLNIHFLGKVFLLITGCEFSHKPGIMSFNVPAKLF